MGKTKIRFRTGVLNNSDIEQIYAYYNARRKARILQEQKPQFYLDGITQYGVIRFWR